MKSAAGVSQSWQKPTRWGGGGGVVVEIFRVPIRWGGGGWGSGRIFSVKKSMP